MRFHPNGCLVERLPEAGQCFALRTSWVTFEEEAVQSSNTSIITPSGPGAAVCQIREAIKMLWK